MLAAGCGRIVMPCFSAHSRALGGHPFGSVVPCVLDHDACPVLLISRLAEHTRNNSLKTNGYHNCGFTRSSLECSLFKALIYALADATTMSVSAP